MCNVLISTLGTSWAIIPELVAFTNPEDIRLYASFSNYEELKKKRKKFNIKRIEEIIIITTDSCDTKTSLKKIKKWKKFIKTDLKIKVLINKGTQDLTSQKECEKMGEIIYLTVLKSLEKYEKVYLSLAGGRKTMSADMQQAGFYFGCDAMLHVVANGNPKEFPTDPCDYINPLSKKYENRIFPVVISTDFEQNLYLDQNKIPQFELPKENISQKKYDNSGKFYRFIQNEAKKANNLKQNYYDNLSGKETNTNFRLLYTLNPKIIEKLKNQKIGVNKDKFEKEYELIKQLPKAELHCHYGGVLNCREMIEVANANSKKVKEYKENILVYRNWLSELRDIIINQDLKQLKKRYKDVKKLRHKFEKIPEPYAVAGFLLQFKGYSALLEKFVFGDYLQEENYSKIGIRKYEKLGDLQGSGILQSKESIIKTSELLLKKARQHKVKYLEIRCSPEKYTKGGLNSRDVVDYILIPFKRQSDISTRLIFIASRHGKNEEIRQHINLAESLIQSKNNYIIGFDLAGDEAAKKAKSLRDKFLKLMKHCLRLTIHAGETVDVSSIWEAVYHLNADRIGHGLSLGQNDKLLNRFIDRKIGVELCPSSNFQINKFRDNFLENTSGNDDYPLKKYLDKGLNVCLNTDNMGISRTDFTNEYMKAARLTKGGLSWWNIYQLIKNGFKNAFCSFEERRKLLIETEKIITSFINRNFK